MPAPALSSLPQRRHGQVLDRSTLIPAPCARPARPRSPSPTSTMTATKTCSLVDGAGAPRLLRNDVRQQQPRGERASSRRSAPAAARTTRFGIGARLELRAGEIYQTRVATGRDDALRARAAPQGRRAAHRVAERRSADDLLPRHATRTSSSARCSRDRARFAYTWDGKRFRFVTDAMWRSAFGMPLGLMGGTSAFAPAGASQEYLRIPGDALAAARRALRPAAHRGAVGDGLRRRGEARRRRSPRFGGRIRRRAVRAARPGEAPALPGRATRRCRSRRSTSAATTCCRRFARATTSTSRTSRQRSTRASSSRTISSSTSAPTRAAPGTLALPARLDLSHRREHQRRALRSSRRSSSAPRRSRCATRRGKWQHRDRRASASRRARTRRSSSTSRGSSRPPIITCAFARTCRSTGTRRSSRATLASSAVKITTLAPLSADLHYRGFSRMYRKGGRYGPYWFAYDDVTKESPWRPITGAFTRFGDVLPLLGIRDDMYVIMGPGRRGHDPVRRELGDFAADGMEARLPALHRWLDQGLRSEHRVRHDRRAAPVPRA